MKVKVKLFAMLRDYLPGSAGDQCVELEVPEATTPHQIIDDLKIPRHLTHLVLVNGVYLDPPQRDRPSLKSGDTLAIWPPIAGG
jgi:molybdopterin converting factor small subunit